MPVFAPYILKYSTLASTTKKTVATKKKIKPY